MRRVLADVPYSIKGFNFSTDEVIAWGTVGLLIVGAGTLIANWRTIVAARRAADAALAQVRAAYPYIDISVDPISPGAQVLVAHVRWLAGVLPARTVGIWVRGPSYLHRGTLPMLGPADGGRRLDLAAVGEEGLQPEGVAVPSTAGKVWRSISWTDPDDKPRTATGEIDTG